MNLNDDIRSELKELSPFIADMEKTNVFTVPDDYFSVLPETLLACVTDNNNTCVDNISKEMKAAVPEGYFDDLSNQILNRIKQQNESSDEEIKSLSPLLHSIKGEQVFRVPANYFQSLPDIVLAKTKPQPAKVISMHKRNSFIRYAAAAVITGALAVGVYKFTGSNHTGVQLASLDPTVETGIKMNQQQFDDALNNLPADAITNYLEKYGNDDDMAAISSSIDENALPNADDYFIDDKTLDNFLEKTTINQTNN
ncbi:hypothetical protein [Ferruginibacter albus]|uniref:hypothetical protein n=1 Tax=Ferruginibacter albus TaxID=2875540 RepID=UPI001CC6B46A|nr:hypothetical protein [Ferruginibacter albus]UAY52356.1 hypothetical protein K9M53_01365 [Ferruginibacter albus]